MTIPQGLINKKLEVVSCPGSRFKEVTSSRVTNSPFLDVPPSGAALRYPDSIPEADVVEDQHSLLMASLKV